MPAMKHHPIGPSLTEVSFLTSTLVPAFRTRPPPSGQGLLADDLIAATRTPQCSGLQQKQEAPFTSHGQGRHVHRVYLVELHPLSKPRKHTLTVFSSPLHERPRFNKKSGGCLQLCNDSRRRGPTQHDAKGPRVSSQKDLDWNLGPGQVTIV